jgi:hypothetical protein
MQCILCENVIEKNFTKSIYLKMQPNALFYVGKILLLRKMGVTCYRAPNFTAARHN